MSWALNAQNRTRTTCVDGGHPRIRRAALLIPMIWILIYTGARWIHPGPLEYGEGVNLLWQQQVEQGLPLYPEVEPESLPWVHNPYTPLGPLLLAGVETLLPLPHLFAAGRLLSWLAIALSAALLYRSVPAQDRWGKLLQVLLFLASPVTLRAASLMRVDALAFAASFASFSVLARTRSPMRWAASGLLATAAVFLKPSFCAAGVVLLVRLLQDRTLKNAGSAVIGGLLPLLGIGIWLFLRETPQLSLHLFTLQRLPRFPGEAFALFAGFCGTHALVCTAGLLSFLMTGATLNEERVYLIASFLVLALTVSVQGAHSGYFLEIWLLLCLGAAHLPLPAPHKATALIVLQFVMFIPWETPPVFSRTYGQEEEPGRVQAFWPGERDREIAHMLSEELRTAEGSVLSTSPGLVLMADGDVTVQLFQFGALIEAGKWEDTPLRTALEDQAFDRILLKGNAERSEDPYLPKDLQLIVAEAYSLHRVLGPWHLYRR